MPESIVKPAWRRAFSRLFIWRSSMRSKWMLLLLLFSLTPLLVMGIISFSISRSTINDKATQYSEHLLNQTADNLDTRLGIYKDMMMQVVGNDEIVGMLRKLNDADAAQFDLDSLSLTTKLSTIVATNPDVQSISFVSDRHYIKGIYRWSSRKKADAAPYLQTIEDGSNFRWYPTRYATFVDSLNSQNSYVFSLAKQVYKISDDSPLGIVAVLDIREEVIKDLVLKAVSNDRDMQSFIVDGNGRLVSYPDDTLIGKSVAEVLGPDGYERISSAGSDGVKFPLSYKHNRLIVNVQKLHTNDWKVVNVISKSALYQDSNRLLQISVAIALVCILFSIVTALLLTNSITKPILQMIKLMKRVMSGDMSVRYKGKQRRDEFDVLGNSFNYMVTRIEELLHAVYVEQDQKRVAELKALQAQIHPHFLYNTLDIIKWTALIQKANQAAEMVSLLSRLLRISIGKGEETVTVEEEIEHVQCYLGIQKFRFNFNIETDVEIAEDVKQLRTPKLILQPIVENAILHAFVDRETGGRILIRCETEPGGGIQFTVSDNGVGMNPEQAGTLLSGQADDPGRSGGIGLANVDERVKLICGQAYGIRIDTKPGAGTRIGIRLPRMI
ncbi:sensor histidine kinase [Cohnella thailandensis]|uniref:histidine kinase n=1 Tax=Cohnella thailandensis TaxID=557557 RepID=A0A841SSM1_9BACL|nr:sensor histidine kinase [Cohnella thailandensis]MBB6634212.1 sensor histidine kinase [Cohnella thailandensis]MBP1972290.1 two-component system sensor histidine kinase YesM [Cohnella thailandensis]